MTSLFTQFCFFINNKNSMLLWVCTIRHHRRQNVVRTSLTFSSHVPLFFSYHILKSSVIYYWTDRWQHRIYLLSRKGIWFVDIVELPVSSVTTHECRIWAITNSGSSINAIFQSWCKPISFSRRENKRSSSNKNLLNQSVLAATWTTWFCLILVH